MTYLESNRAVSAAQPINLQAQVLIAKGLTIARGDVLLCSQVDFSVSSGQILHIQGPNGIGKTTLMMMLAGLIPSSSFDHESLIWGDQTSEDWSVLYIGHLIGLSAGLSVRENLRFLQALNSKSESESESEVDLEAALSAVGLSGYEDINVAQLSSGQKRRVSLARLWLTDDAAQLWLLDEPFTALDAEMTSKISERVIEHTKVGGRVILTSHQPFSIPAEILNLTQFVVRSSDCDLDTVTASER